MTNTQNGLRSMQSNQLFSIFYFHQRKHCVHERRPTQLASNAVEPTNSHIGTEAEEKIEPSIL